MRCEKCSYDNPPDYRYCGMCGATLGETVDIQAPEMKRAAVSRDRVAPRTPAPVREDRTAAPVRDERYAAPVREERYQAPVREERAVSPVREERLVREERIERPTEPISGPSFLGLGSDSSSGGGYSGYSSSPDYLLEDEEPKRSFGRFFLILFILAAVGGLGWMRYTRGNWELPWPKKTTQAQNAPQQASSPPVTDSGSGPAATIAPPSDSTNAAPSDTQSAAPATPPETDGQPATTAAGTPPAEKGASGDATAPEKSEPAPADKAPLNSKNSPKAGKSASAAASKDETADDEDADASEPVPAVRHPGSQAPPKKIVEADDDASDTTATRSKSTTRPPVEAASPDDALVANAEKYLYGRGVPQNCDRALGALRAAAARSNSRARSLLGTMYATGHCVGRDLPNAYRWFALASRENADNMWVQRNLEMIWREMTPQERQLATQRSQ